MVTGGTGYIVRLLSAPLPKVFNFQRFNAENPTNLDQQVKVLTSLGKLGCC